MSSILQPVPVSDLTQLDHVENGQVGHPGTFLPGRGLQFLFETQQCVAACPGIRDLLRGPRHRGNGRHQEQDHGQGLEQVIRADESDGRQHEYHGSGCAEKMSWLKMASSVSLRLTCVVRSTRRREMTSM